MNPLTFAFLLVLATINASPVPTQHSPSHPVLLSREGRKGLTKGKNRDSNPAESRNVYNFHNSFIIKPDNPVWYQKQADQPKQKYPKKWGQDENEFVLAHTGWSPMFGKKIQSLIDSTSEKPKEKTEPEVPAENVNPKTHPEVPTVIDEKTMEATKEIQKKPSTPQPPNYTEQQNLGLGKFYDADLPYSSQNLNIPSQYSLEDFKTQKPSTNEEFVYFNPHSQQDAYPAFAIEEETLSEVHFPSNQNNFNGHSQGGQPVKENNQPSEEEREYQIFLTKENIIESFPNYQGAVSYSYNSIADGELQSAGQGGGHRFYSSPAFKSERYSSQGRDSAHQQFQHYEQIPQIHDYSYQFGVVPVIVSGGGIETRNRSPNRYLPPVKNIVATSETKVEANNNGNDAVINTAVSKDEVPYQIQISHKVPVQVETSTPEHRENTDVNVDNKEQVTEVVILKSVSSENLDVEGTAEIPKEAEVTENVLVIEGNDMTDAVMEVAEVSRNSEVAKEKQTILTISELPKKERVPEASAVGADQEATPASPTGATPTEESVKEIQLSDEQVASLEEGLAASDNLNPEKDSYAGNYLNRGHGINALSAKYHRDYSAPVRYRFQYAVEDKTTGDIKSHEEERDGDLTKGKYSVHDADGLVRTVDYFVDGPSGFQASVMRKAKEMQLLRQKRIMKRLL